MYEELQSWWLAVSPEMKTGLLHAGVIVAALVGGHFIGSMVARILRKRNFDATVRLPGAHAADPDSTISPTFIAGMIVRLTVWATAAWWLAHQYGRPDIAATIGLVVKRTWALAAVLVAALTVAGLLASRIIQCLGGQARPASDMTTTQVTPPSRFNVAGVTGAVAYCLVLLVALLIVADMFEWPLTRNAALVLWQFGEYLLVAGAALAIGCLGAGWARELVNDQGKMSPEKRAGQYTALAIVTVTSVLAVLVLLSSAGLLLALAALAVVAVLLWLVRGYLPDILAGMQLRAHAVRQASFEGAVWQVTEIGFISTQLCLNGQICSVQNRLVLESRMQQSPQQPSHSRETPMEPYANQGAGEAFHRGPIHDHDQEAVSWR